MELLSNQSYRPTSIFVLTDRILELSDPGRPSCESKYDLLLVTQEKVINMHPRLGRLGMGWILNSNCQPKSSTRQRTWLTWNLPSSCLRKLAEAPTKASMKIEVAKYLALPRPVEKVKVDILRWWKYHEKSLPLLSCVARGILAVPASSSSSERTLSTLGNIVNAERCSLEADTTRKLTFCQQN